VPSTPSIIFVIQHNKKSVPFIQVPSSSKEKNYREQQKKTPTATAAATTTTTTTNGPTAGRNCLFHILTECQASPSSCLI